MMKNRLRVLDLDPFKGLGEKKEMLLFGAMRELHEHHVKKSEEYKLIVDSIGQFSLNPNSLEDLPFLPVSLFKDHLLKSIEETDVLKVLRSSGTSGTGFSQIILDRDTAIVQTKTLAKIMKHFLGAERVPMIIVDSKATLKSRESFSARAAGIIGMSNFGRDHFYMLDEKFEPLFEELTEYLKKYNGKRKFIFGFTYMIWENLIQKISSEIDLSGTVLVHGGGWKKLIDKGISNKKYKEDLERLGIENVHDYYGMVEQVGSIYMECSEGFLHCPNYSNIILRSHKNWGVIEDYGVEGIIQTQSVIPTSYPGYSLLTEDMGVIHGKDDCKCGLPGKYFSVSGRISKTDVRGCSDSYQ